MQLIRNPQTRKQLWSRQARATRWGISCVFPKAHDEPVAVVEANYTVDYDTMVDVYDALAFGQVNSIPDYGELTKDRTILKYADEHRPFIRKCYSTASECNVDRRKAILKILGLKSPVLPTAIVFERLG